MAGESMYKVIVADDEPFMLEGWRTMIDWQACGYELCGTATDGEEALALIGTVEPDLVVTDIQMPVLDGLGLIRTMREELGHTAKVIIVSGYSEFAYAQEAIRYRVDEYVLKPLVTEEIHQVLLELIGPLDKRKEEKKQVDGLVAPKDTPFGSADLGKIEEYDLEQMTTLSNQILAWIEAGDITEIAAAVDDMLYKKSKSDVGWVPNVVRYIHGELLGKYSGNDEGMVLLREKGWHEIDGWSTGTLKQLFIRIAQVLSPSSDSGSRGLVSEAIDYLKRHYRNKVTLQEVAQYIHVNSAYLGQQFKRETGVSFSEYVHRIRIEEARRLLRRTNMKISDIACELGYHDAEYFTHKFKAFTGELPSVYKNKI
ncbi:response regulator transcription factor [Paenibacillus sp. JNUCC31]|uniref:response regulator transcription factor n=1 Tax=Paenibacillus sp. JNUCC-31 TaxID=2777983 RepID=UPI001E4DAE1C|nr:helix-turn-helix domain-containing protein [Paenibacillus sp. JNUCC-31]